MERSGSQKALLVISIINIILAVFLIITGVMVNVGGALIAGAPETAELAGEISSELGETVTGSEVGGIAALGGLLLIFYGIVEVLMGILGIRAANDNQKIMPVWVLAVISLVLGVFALIASFTNPNGNIASAVGGLLGSALMFWIANNIKTQAGR